MSGKQVGWYDGERVHQMNARPVGDVPQHLAHTAGWVAVTVDDAAECENCNQLARALREATEAPTFMGEPVTQWPRASNWVWTHIKSGGEYSLLGNAMIQSAKPLEDLSEVYVYQGADGNMWVRPVAEFNERFKRTRPIAAPITLTPAMRADAEAIGACCDPLSLEPAEPVL